MKYPYYFWPESFLQWSSCTGSNAKHTLVLSSEIDIAGKLAFLKKILRSVELDFDQDIHFLIAPQDLQTSLMSDPQIVTYQSLILFGLRPSQVGIWSEDTEGCKLFYFEKVACIIAPPLDRIENHAEHKKVLWTALRTVFANSPS